MRVPACNQRKTPSAWDGEMTRYEIRAVGAVRSRQSRANGQQATGRKRASAALDGWERRRSPPRGTDDSASPLYYWPSDPSLAVSSIDRSIDRMGSFEGLTCQWKARRAVDRLSVVERTNGRQACRQATPRPRPSSPAPITTGPHTHTRHILTHSTNQRTHTINYSGTMADKGPVTIRSRKFIRNALLARRQMVRGGSID